MAAKEGTQGTTRQRDFTGVWRAVSCDGLHSYLAAAGVVDGEGKRAIVHRMSLPVHELRMYDESRLTCTVVRYLRSSACPSSGQNALPSPVVTVIASDTRISNDNEKSCAVRDTRDRPRYPFRVTVRCASQCPL